MLEFLSAPSILPGAEFRIFVALAFTGAAAFFDMFNRKWVPNWLLYSSVAAAVFLNIAFFEQALFIQAMLFGIAVFAIGYPLYRLGQLGGADVYVLAAIAAAIPYLSKPLLAASQSVPYPFILSVLAPTGVAFILHMLARFIPFISRSLAKGKVKFTAKKLAAPILLVCAFSIFIYAVSSLPFELPPAYFAILAFLAISLVFFSLFKEQIKDSMVEFLPAPRLEQEDVLALEKMDGRLVKKLKLGPLLDKKAIAALKKSKAKSFPVYTKMPFFLPYLFLGLVFSVLFGDLLFYIVAG